MAQYLCLYFCLFQTTVRPQYIISALHLLRLAFPPYVVRTSTHALTCKLTCKQLTGAPFSVTRCTHAHTNMNSRSSTRTRIQTICKHASHVRARGVYGGDFGRISRFFPFFFCGNPHGGLNKMFTLGESESKKAKEVTREKVKEAESRLG